MVLNHTAPCVVKQNSKKFSMIVVFINEFLMIFVLQNQVNY